MLLDRFLTLPPRTSRPVRHRDVRVPMRDGATLLADIYLPARPSNQPTVLLRSPYGRGSVFGLMAQAFAHRGYNTIIQSCRGTFGSEGRFHPFFQESADGLDTVAWIENQPWFSGRLGLYGSSYMGHVQWAMAAELGNRLCAMAMSVTTSDFQEAIHDGGGFRLQDLLVWAHLLEHQERSHRLRNALRERIFGDPLRRFYAQLPVHTIDTDALGRRVDFWREWAGGDPQDARWAAIRFTDTIARIKTPVSMVTGWSDFLFAYQMRDFQALRANGCTARITVGQWTHASIGMIAESLRDALTWFDIHLKGASPTRENGPSGVKFWINGPDRWEQADAWPPANTHSTQLALSADGRLRADHFMPGSRSFAYDPHDPTPSLAGPMLANSKGRGDVRALAARCDVLSFDGAVLEQPIDIIGDVRVTLTTSSSRAQHDLFVCLCDVDAKGRTINITDGYVRLGLAATAGASTRVTSIKASPAAWQVPRGHRLRLLVAGGAFPRFARNLGVHAKDANDTAMTPVDITLHCASVDACVLEFSIRA